MILTREQLEANKARGDYLETRRDEVETIEQAWAEHYNASMAINTLQRQNSNLHNKLTLIVNKLTEDEVLEEVCRHRGGVSQSIQAVYEKYKHLDKVLCYEQWTHDTLPGTILHDLWRAIKAHVEEAT